MKVLTILIIALSITACTARTPKIVRKMIKDLPDTIKVNFPTGKMKYSKYQVKALYRCDTASFNLLMRVYQKQQAKKLSDSLIEKYKKAVRKYFFPSILPYRYSPSIRRFEIIKDQFGNEGFIYFYENDTYQIENGDSVLIGGVPLNKHIESGKDLW